MEKLTKQAKAILRAKKLWDKRYEELKALFAATGATAVSPTTHPTLYHWCCIQRQAYRQGLLPKSAQAKLKTLSFVWDSRSTNGEAIWMAHYAELVEYKRQHGSPHVPRSVNYTLANWLHNIRRVRKGYISGRALTKKQCALLDKLGFNWDPHSWEVYYQRLVTEIHRFRNEGGTLNRRVVIWYRRQLSLHRKGKLSVDKYRRIKQIRLPAIRGKKEQQWEHRFEELREFKRLYGHTHPPITSHKKLRHWCTHMRERGKSGLLPKDRIKRLQQLGFTWGTRSTRRPWKQIVTELAANLNHPSQASTIINLRFRYRHGTLSRRCIKDLKAIGLSFKPVKNSKP